jgi:WD40 repeat protein
VIKRIDFLPCKLFTVAGIDKTTIAVAGSDNRIRLVDCSSGEITARLDGHQGSISSLVFCDGSLYSGGFDATVRKWKVGGDAGARVAEKEKPEEGKR